MNAIVFYLGALSLYGVGFLLLRKTSYYTRSGGAEYEKRRRRKLIGTTLMVVATIALATGVIAQFYSNMGPVVETPPSPIATEWPSSTTPSINTAPSISTAQSNSTAQSGSTAWLSSAGNPMSMEPASTAPPGTTPSLPHQDSPVSSATPGATRDATSSIPSQPKAEVVAPLLTEALQLVKQKQLDAALDKVNAALLAAPQNPDAYGLRGDIYAEKSLWTQAEKDYQTALKLGGRNKAQITFNLADVEFLQKKYDVARNGLTALTQDRELGDLAAYMVFLCDLAGGHEDSAAKELDAFNLVGANASYYFANAASSVYHHKTEEARRWLYSAAEIYETPKFSQYAASLIALGYLPLPPASP